MVNTQVFGIVSDSPGKLRAALPGTYYMGHDGCVLIFHQPAHGLYGPICRRRVGAMRHGYQPWVGVRYRSDGVLKWRRVSICARREKFVTDSYAADGFCLCHKNILSAFSRKGYTRYHYLSRARKRARWSTLRLKQAAGRS
jgi:hypothetical protein